MGGIIKSLFGGGQDKIAKQNQALQIKAQADNQRASESAQAQQLQSQGQQSADLDRSLAGARKAGRGRRLLLDPIDSGKATLG